ncbi:hypothetical protein LQ772_08115 [Frateuria edaphi]|uniref:hypothetical protein n=1 Tax=Frateuria edaphi TaxID=2898793 RepID=UPI001E5C1289|nr:hypothetical protein [Frateuria edaphi]UGB47234.1 hypothetical protein LQ772_08115 [Frateuria edaphi]
MREDRKRILALAKQMAEAGGGAIFPMDLYTYGAVKRNLSTSAALITLTEASNMLGVRSMLRVHIDTALRYAAAWFVDDPHVFATRVHSGEHIRKIKDREGRLLLDARLVELLTPMLPWLPKVYDTLSSFVHFSGSHVTGAIKEVDSGGRIAVELSEFDEHYPESSWIEIMDCAREATRALIYYLSGWVLTKNISREQFDAMKAARGNTFD